MKPLLPTSSLKPKASSLQPPAFSLQPSASSLQPSASVWRLLDTGVLTGAENMALDQVLPEVRSRGLSPNTVRFLQFSPPVALVGRHQRVEQEVRLAYCRGSGIDINRRVTGGGAILFDRSQLGWELIASSKELGADSFALSFQRRIINAAIRGLRALGLNAAFRPRNDIEIAGRKISGTGGMEEGDAFLFQGTLLIDFDIAAMVRALRIPTEKLKQSELDSSAERVTWLARELGAAPPIETVKAAIARGFEEEFGVRLEPGALNEAERARFGERLPFFESDEWIIGDRRRQPSRVDTFSGFHRTDNAAFVAHVQIDTVRRRLRYVAIEGDYFISPSRAMLDLEAALKDVRLDVDEIGRVIREFWARDGIKTNGFGAEDVLAALRTAVEKTQLLAHGLSAQDAASLFVLNGAPNEVLSRECRLLLLPYCSKLPGCDYRQREDCAECGECGVGEAFAVARERGMEVITICTFEHLIETLSRARAQGHESYVGCCCEAFYRKHYDDFIGAGLPGVLIDIAETTCYDLKVQDLAYAGRFENQTNLNLPLLRQVLATTARGVAPGTGSISHSAVVQKQNHV